MYSEILLEVSEHVNINFNLILFNAYRQYERLSNVNSRVYKRLARFSFTTNFFTFNLHILI